MTQVVPRTSGAVVLLTIWLVTLFALPARLAFGQFGAPSVLVGAVLTVLWAAAVLSRGSFPGGAQPVRTALLILGLVLIVGYLVAARRVLTAGEAGAANRTLVTYGAALGAALFATDALANRAELTTVVRRVVWGGVFLATLGMLHSIAGLELASRIQLPFLTWNKELAVGIERVSFDRAVGTATHPIEYGVVLTMILPLALHLAITDHQHRRTWWWGASALMGCAALLSLSRSAAIGLAICLAATLVALPSPQLRRRFLGGLVISAVALQTVAPGLIRTVRGLFLGLSDDGSFQARVVDYREVDRYVEGHLWFGRGLGTFLPDEYILLDNQVLKLILEIGLVGTAVFLGVGIVGLLAGRTMRRRYADPEVTDLARSLEVTLAIALVTCFTFDYLGFTIARSMFFLTLGLLGALWRVGRSEVSEQPTAQPEHVTAAPLLQEAGR